MRSSRGKYLDFTRPGITITPMNRKVIAGVVFAVVFLSLAPYAYSKKYKLYENKRYSYVVQYPSAWYIGYLGGSEDTAAVIRICSDAADTDFSDGGQMNPLVEIIVSDLGEMKREGAKFPEIKTSKDWVLWERSNWDKDERERVGAFKDEKIMLGGIEGVKTTYLKPAFPDAGPVIDAIFFNQASSLVYSIKYLGTQPKYKDHLKDLQTVLESFAPMK